MLLMAGFQAGAAIFQKIMDVGSLHNTFGEIRDLVMSMLETYNYEKTLLQTTNKIVANDLYWVGNPYTCLL